MIRRILRNPWIPQTPTPKQMRFLLTDNREAFFGGAAGGGKSSAILMGAAMYLEEKAYNAILFRKTLEDHKLAEGLIPRSLEWWGGKAKWNGQDHRWTFPSGATVTFGYMSDKSDHYRYQSSAYQYIGFDELSHFEENQYRYMFSRLRRLEGVEIPLRMRAASNPGGIGHEWVKRRFIDPGSIDRPFIPSRLEDNPYLDREEYRESLSELDPTTREQLLNGDWQVRPPGGMFKRGWFTLVKDAPVGSRAVRYWDLAATAPAPGKDPAWTVGALISINQGVYYIHDIQRLRGTPMEVEHRVAQTAILDRARTLITDIWMEQEPGSSGVNTIDHYAREVLVGYSFRGDKVTGDKETRAAPLSSAAEAGNVKLVISHWVEAFLDEAEAFPDSRYKDQIDAVSGAVGKLSEPSGTVDAFTLF
jgi:predicted phage terminase large subunit-like protein